ncbi:MAG TPA: tetratricopeptide repeat protein [Flavilitoribacter sp.]|nr:tetratricopeptide repeat protein [Lewinellaceae bacterium]HMQ59786.1 tetratricopeptide repeat protein [Flavilitoribacter sp.]HMQ86058.1 tetratricopeptide repeat protein [Flavilitoribacter sp.]
MHVATPLRQNDIGQWELKLLQQTEPLQRLLIIDRLAAYFAYTNLQRAEELLEEQQAILDKHDYPDYRLNLFLHKATVENQRYRYQEANLLFSEAIKLLEERGDVKQQAETYIDTAGPLMNLERLEDCASVLEKASRLLRTFPDRGLAARIICREGFISLHVGNYSQAIEQFLEAEKQIAGLDRPLEIKDFYFLILVHSGLGKVHERNDEHEKSVRSYLKAVHMCESLQMTTRLSWHYLNVGTGYMAMQEPENAELYFQKAIEASDDANQHPRASAYGNLGYCYLEKERYEEALDLFNRAEQLYKAISEHDYNNFSVIEGWRGRLYSELNRQDEALEHLAQAYEYASKSGDNKQLSNVCKEMASFYAGLKEYKNAYEFQLMHDKFAERHLQQTNQRKQMELEIKYEADKKKQEAELLRLQATRLQLKALRAQMNPHFMYNALNSIQNFITSNDTTAAAKYLAKFAMLMRKSLEYSDLEIISLEKEIGFLEEYLFINQKLRFEDRLSYEIIVDDDIEEDILGVPTMIVQPYVENAIEHGLRPKQNGKVTVRFSLLADDAILCIVEDNGIGREKARQLRMQDSRYQNHRSRGTRITEQRLQILNNSKDNEFFVRTTDLREDKTGEALGTKVEIRIPVMDIPVK